MKPQENLLPRKRIMIVDDNATNLMFAKTALFDRFDVFTVPSAAKMFNLLPSSSPDLILLDISMPEMDGYEALKILKSKEEWKNIPVIFLTGMDQAKEETDGLALGAIDYIYKPFEPRLLKKRIENYIQLAELKDTLAKNDVRLTDRNKNLDILLTLKNKSSRELCVSIFSVLSDMVENRNHKIQTKRGRTRDWVKILIDAMLERGVYKSTLESWNMEEVAMAAELHDLGKIEIPEALILKKSRLTPAELEVVKKHTIYGELMLERMGTQIANRDFVAHAQLFCLNHHERWDGSGYPRALKAHEIPLQGRIMAIVDVYDALTNVRPYKKAFPHYYAIKVLLEGSSGYFDPSIMEVFREIAWKFDIGEDK
ncbi:MAG: response regulator [Deltaproteobacteria bacterium]|jgi:putative two-component system response regulator|nr:response regulator [Deltaproteobacteria bacterium]